jgi:hypothetical protein
MNYTNTFRPIQSSTIAILIFCLVLFNGCSKDEPSLPKLPETISGELYHIGVAYNFGEYFREVSFSFTDYATGSAEYVTIQMPTKASPANAELTISETDIITPESQIDFWRDSNGDPVDGLLINAKPIKSPSVTITFYKDATVEFYNPANDGQTDPLEYLDAPKEIKIDANSEASASFQAYGYTSNMIYAQYYIKRERFTANIKRGIMALIDSDPDLVGLRRVPLRVELNSYNPFYK